MSVSSNAPLKENKMGVMPVGKLLATMAIPMMASMLFQALYNVVDSIFVSQISQDALNAVSLAFPLQNLMIAFGSGTGVGMNALLSRSLGAKKNEEANRSANTGIILYIITAIIFAAIGVLFSPTFFRLQTDNQNIIAYGTSYTTICLGFGTGVFMQFCFERLLQATGKTFPSMITQMTGALINIIFDPILIFGYFGFPKMGVTGAAVATVAGQVVAAIFALILNLKVNHEIHLNPFHYKFDGKTAKEIYSIGVPSIIMMCISSFMTFGLNKILIGFTEAATAVFGAYFKLQSFIFMPVFGLNNGMIPIISYNYGAGKLDRVKKCIRNSVITATTIMIAGCLLFELAPNVLLSFFNPSDEMMGIGMTALRIIGIHFPLAGFCIITGSVCQAIGNPLYSMIVSIIRQLVVLLPAAFLLSLTGRLELVWFAFLIAESTSFLLSNVFIRMTMKKVETSVRTGR